MRGRFFKFRIPNGGLTFSEERGSHPCIKVELYGSPGRLRSYAVLREKKNDRRTSPTKQCINCTPQVFSWVWTFPSTMKFYYW